MNKVEAAALVALLVNAYPYAKFTTENAEVYEARILDLDARETQAAIEELSKTSRMLPTPADIRAEVNRGRRERTIAEDNAARMRLGSASIDRAGPSPAEWGRVLARLLDDQVRYERMARPWYERHGKPYPGYPAAEFLELAKLGASGKDVRSEVARAAGAGDFEELERRYP
jgi:hypothetical protein